MVNSTILPDAKTPLNKASQPRELPPIRTTCRQSIKSTVASTDDLKRPHETGSIKMEETHAGSPKRNSIGTIGDIVLAPHKSKTSDLWALGITIVIGGQYFSWNAGYESGFLSYWISTLIIGTGYFFLCCSLAEISSALPFCGGAYGLSRCTLGYTAGFLVGCCQTLEYIAYTASATVSFGQMIISINPSMESLAPVIWLLLYLVSLAIHIIGGKWFWRLNMLIAIISVLIVLVFCVGSYVIQSENNTFFSRKDPGFYYIGGFAGFLRHLPIATWDYVGVESLNFASDDVIEPKRTIPIAQLACMGTLLLTSWMMYFITPGWEKSISAAAQVLDPMTKGLVHIFSISRNWAVIFSLPAVFATSFGFIYSFGRLIASMAKSKLFPPILQKSNTSGSPYMALIAGCFLCYLLCFLVAYVPSVGSQMFNICLINGLLAYMANCIGYIILRLKFTNLAPKFHSPVGLPGAIISLVIWILSAISIIFFQHDHYVTISVFAVEWIVFLIYYYAWAKRRQTFSAEENKIMLVAHIMKFNGEKTKKHHNGTSNQGTHMSSAKGDKKTVRTTKHQESTREQSSPVHKGRVSANSPSYGRKCPSLN